MENDLFFRIAYLLLWFVFISARLVPSRNVPSVRRSRKERIESIKQEGIHAFFLLFIAIYGNLTVAALYLSNPPWIQWSYLYLPLELRVVGLILGVVSPPICLLGWKNASQLLLLHCRDAGRTQAHNNWTVSQDTPPFIHGDYSVPCCPGAGFRQLALPGHPSAMIPDIYVRMNKEEQMLIEEFGDEYRAYMKRTGRLLPRLRSHEAD